MWHDLTIGRAFKLLIASLGAFMCSLAIAMVIGRYIPQVHGSDGALRPDPGRIYTLEELDKAEKAAIARGEELRRQWQEMSFADHVRDLKIHALWGLWVPWFLLPIIVRVKNLLYFAVVLTIPVGGALIHLVPVEELWLLLPLLQLAHSRERSSCGDNMPHNDAFESDAIRRCAPHGAPQCER